MKIISLKYIDHASNWTFGPLTFDMLTLLVGISGVGKSHILTSISRLAGILRGETKGLAGSEWDLSFEHGGSSFAWRGMFDLNNSCVATPLGFSQDSDKCPAFLYESLEIDGRSVYEMQNNEARLENNAYSGLSPCLSVFNIFTESPNVKRAREALSRVYFIGHSSQSGFFVPTLFAEELEGYKFNMPEGGALSPDSFFDASIPCIQRLAAVYILFRPLFDEIKNEYIEVFPSVTDIRFVAGKGGEHYLLGIKEEGTRWIMQDEMSSGMYKTLLHLSELKLSHSDSVILIDEFENSLGVNCIDVMSDCILQSDKNHQFIMTSHHPYIINSIPMTYWKIVIRKGSAIATKAVSDLNIGKSSHEAFKQLMNSRDYLEGIK